MPLEMKRFRVKYKIMHEREFYAPSIMCIKQILSEQNEIEIVDYEEIPDEKNLSQDHGFNQEGRVY